MFHDMGLTPQATGLGALLRGRLSTSERLLRGLSVLVCYDFGRRGNQNKMANVSGVVEQLKRELERAKKEVEQFGAALVALGRSSSNGSRRTMSAAGRRRISLAQKARWAKQNAQAKAAKPKRVVSASARRKMAAAQRARWSKMKGQKKAA
jgi:hypothetical protein